MDNNKKQILLLIVAVVLGIAATAVIGFAVNSTIERHDLERREEYEAKQKKIVAEMQAQADQRAAILQQQIQAVRTEQAQVVQKQIAELQSKLQQQQATNAGAQPIKKNKPSLALKTPQGKRAVTVKIDSLSAVGGLLNPGDMVDIIARLNVPEGRLGKDGERKQKTITAMVFQGLEVLAVNTNLDETGTRYEEQQNSPAIKVTLAVDPHEAGYLVFADKNGTLEFALRSPQETERQMVKTTTWKTLADYVLQNQGADIDLPDDLKGIINQDDDKPAKPDIQIFRGGKEL